MKTLLHKNKDLVLIILVVAIGALVAWYSHYAKQNTLNDLSNAQTTGTDCGVFFCSNKNGFYHSGESYAQALYRHLSNGYISSSQCDQYGEGLMLQYHQLEAKLGESSPLLLGYVYLPQKQRCIGLTAYSPIYGDYKKELAKELVDIATLYNNPTTIGYIVSCLADYTTQTFVCDDAFGNNYSNDVTNPEIPSMPDPNSLQSVYGELENLAQQ